MFTGITEETGKITAVTSSGSSMSLSISASFAPSLTEGESVAVNGICLTVTSRTDTDFTADVTPETFRRTSLKSLGVNSKVNLERAMKADGRFGGHIVSGHIDGTGTLVSFTEEENAVNAVFRLPESLGYYIIEKGSVCIDGISLTVASVAKEGSSTVFSVAVIPHTWKNTTLSSKQSGDTVNIECDITAKYIAHFLSEGLPPPADSNSTDDQKLKNFLENQVSFH